MIFASAFSALRLGRSLAHESGADVYPGGPVASRPTVADATASFEQIYDRNVAFVARSARRLGVNEVFLEDVVQEIFLVAFRRLPDFEGHSAMSTWLYGIALRVVRSHRRTMVRANLHGVIDRTAGAPESAAARPSDRPDAAAETADAYRKLLKLLDELDDDKREIFVLAELEQVPIPEVARLLGLKLNTAYSRLRGARAAFEAALKRAGRFA